MNQKKFVRSGSPWEDKVGYSRAVRSGNIIEVSGTTAVSGSAVVGLNDYYEQTRYIIEKIISAVVSAGGKAEDIVRTRIFICDITHWEEVAKAHTEFFPDTRPAATMVEVSRLISPELLVEIEATAVII